MTTLIIFRHGNTFESGQTPTRVGARTDMALTARGLEQADIASAFVQKNYPGVTSILAGPLVRTAKMAEIIAKPLGLEVTIDERLREVDYGLWENRTDDAIKAAFGEQVLKDWEESGLWPKDMGFLPPRDVLIARLTSFLDEQKTKPMPLAVTSNGILRILYGLLTGNTPGPEAKVKTGYGCVLTHDGSWQIKAWNEKPLAG